MYNKIYSDNCNQYSILHHLGLQLFPGRVVRYYQIINLHIFFIKNNNSMHSLKFSTGYIYKKNSRYEKHHYCNEIIFCTCMRSGWLGFHQLAPSREFPFKIYLI